MAWGFCSPRYNGEVTYTVPETQHWGSIFSEVERAKDRLNIEDYSVSQTSLEQIFLGFASDQNTDSEQHKKPGQPGAAVTPV